MLRNSKYNYHNCQHNIDLCPFWCMDVKVFIRGQSTENTWHFYHKYYLHEHESMSKLSLPQILPSQHQADHVWKLHNWKKTTENFNLKLNNTLDYISTYTLRVWPNIRTNSSLPGKATATNFYVVLPKKLEYSIYNSWLDEES